MKKVRIFLSAAAVLLAVAATFAVKPNALMDGFEFIPPSGGQQASCRLIEDVDCLPTGSNACTSVNGFDIRETNTVTNCGASLKRP